MKRFFIAFALGAAVIGAMGLFMTAAVLLLHASPKVLLFIGFVIWSVILGDNILNRSFP